MAVGVPDTVRSWHCIRRCLWMRPLWGVPASNLGMVMLISDCTAQGSDGGGLIWYYMGLEGSVNTWG